MLSRYALAYKIVCLCVTSLLLVACEKSSHQDIKDFITETKRKPPGKVPGLPIYAPYKPYVYNAAQIRSPFEPPALIEQKVLAASSNVKPDLDRQKQRLEGFGFSSLLMVGTVKKNGVLWGLIRDPEGSIERVKTGYYLGKNHGRITELNAQSIDVVEIVPNGLDGWLERPNLITLKEKK
ncbi:MAG: type IV pilus assembly protein PilP [Kiritimatiellia bacterium]|jgi:type IV pilus assembly protein PilP